MEPVGIIVLAIFMWLYSSIGAIFWIAKCYVDGRFTAIGGWIVFIWPLVMLHLILEKVSDNLQQNKRS